MQLNLCLPSVLVCHATRQPSFQIMKNIQQNISWRIFWWLTFDWKSSFVTTYEYIHQIFMKFSMEVLYKTLSRKRRFGECRLSDSHTLHGRVNEFIPIHPTFCNWLVKYGIWNFHIMTFTLRSMRISAVKAIFYLWIWTKFCTFPHYSPNLDKIWCSRLPL